MGVQGGVMRQRPVGAALLAIFVAIISAVHLLQAFTGALGDPRALVIEHVIVAVLGLVAAWGIWTGKRWAPWALAAAGLTIALLIVSLGPLLRMDSAERAGLWTGAACVAGLTAGPAWYLARRRSPTT
jgi:peptidoglycan/LPS O-acetylase OafA/YrhL